MAMSARSLMAATKQATFFIGACAVLFWGFFYAATYAPLAMPNGSAALLGPSGYFAVAGFFSALAIGLVLRVPFRLFFSDQTRTWAFRCSMVAALAYLALGLDTFESGAMPLWPYVDAVLLVLVFTLVVGVGKDAGHATAI